jgi:hypothetical protein
MRASSFIAFLRSVEGAGPYAHGGRARGRSPSLAKRRPGGRALLCLLTTLLGACGSGSDAEPQPFGFGPSTSGSAGSAGQSGGADTDGDGVADRDDCAPADPKRARLQSGLYEDRDRDGYTRGASFEACLGLHETAAEAGFATAPQGDDCDDADPQAHATSFVYADADADGFGAGAAEARCLPSTLPAGYALTGGDCDDADPAGWQELAYAHVDADGDGTTHPLAGSLCAGVALPAGYALEPSGDDCDDADASVWQLQTLFADLDADGVGAGAAQTFCTAGSLAGFSPSGTDCAPNDAAAWQTLAYGYRDADGDGFNVPSPGALCAGTGLPSGYSTSPQGNDCNDANPAIYAQLTGHDDGDGDGVGAGPPLSFCTAGALPAGHVSSGTDCAPDDATRWQTLAYAHVDGDGDGITTPSTGSICAGATLPPPYAAQPAGNDCDDDDPNLTRWLVLYPDGDGDGVGTDPRQVLCLGAALPAGLSIYGDDVDDTDPEIVEDEEDDEEFFLLLF